MGVPRREREAMRGSRSKVDALVKTSSHEPLRASDDVRG